MYMTKLSNEIFYISAEELRQGKLDGTWRNCRTEYYIRNGIDPVSVDEKIESLVNIEDKEAKTGTIKVLEPLAVNQFFDEDGNTINEIISGNTRSHAILKQLNTNNGKVRIGGNSRDAYDITITEFEPIPYRIFEEPIGLDEAINFQTSTNDFTKRHNPVDIALKVVSMKPVLEQRFLKEGSRPKEAAGKATEYLCQLFKKTKQNLAQYTSVINKGTDVMRKYVYDGKMSFDTALTIIQKLGGDKATADDIDKSLAAIYQMAKTQVAANQGISIDRVDDGQVGVYKSHVTSYFADIDAANKAREQSSNDDDADIPDADIPTVVDSGSNSSVPPASVESINLEEFVSSVNRDVINRARLINPVDYTPNNAKDVDDLTMAQIEYLLKTRKFFTPSDHALDIAALIHEAYLKRTEDIEGLADKMEKSELANYRKLIAKAAKPLENLKKALYETPDEVQMTDAGSEQEAKAEVLEIA